MPSFFVLSPVFPEVRGLESHYYYGNMHCNRIPGKLRNVKSSSSIIAEEKAERARASRQNSSRIDYNIVPGIQKEAEIVYVHTHISHTIRASKNQDANDIIFIPPRVEGQTDSDYTRYSMGPPKKKRLRTQPEQTLKSCE